MQEAFTDTKALIVGDVYQASRLRVSVLTGETVAVRVVVDSRTIGIQTEHTQNQTNKSNEDVENGKGNLARWGEPLALVEMQPVNAAKTVAEPAGEQSTLRNH